MIENKLKTTKCNSIAHLQLGSACGAADYAWHGHCNVGRHAMGIPAAPRWQGMFSQHRSSHVVLQPCQHWGSSNMHRVCWQAGKAPHQQCQQSPMRKSWLTSACKPQHTLLQLLLQVALSHSCVIAATVLPQVALGQRCQ